MIAESYWQLYEERTEPELVYFDEAIPDCQMTSDHLFTKIIH
jgi:hypothetical protein